MQSITKFYWRKEEVSKLIEISFGDLKPFIEMYSKIDDEIEIDTFLLKSEHLDSLGVVQLISSLEQLTGQAISAFDFTMDDFESPRSILAALNRVIADQ